MVEAFLQFVTRLSATIEMVCTAQSLAQRISEKRNLLSRKRNSRKDAWITSYVEDKLKLGWSPEQIAGRLKRDHGKKLI